MKEIYGRNGVTDKITEYKNEDDYTETIFRNGRAIIKIYYQDGERKTTEQIRE